MPARVILYGTSHQLQQIRRPHQSTQLGQARDHYRNDISQLISNQSVGVVLEEANEQFPSVAKKLAEEREIPYASINMSMAERQTVGWIGDSSEDALNPNTSGNRMREDYMFGKIAERIADGQTILVVCGQLHVAGIKNRLQSIGIIALTDSSFNRNWHAEFNADYPVPIGVETSPELKQT